MALTITVTPGELARQAALIYEGRAFEVFLVDNGALSVPLTVANTYAEWKAAEISGNGYGAVEGTIGFGTYNGATARIEMPPMVAGFTAEGGPITYDTVCVRVAGGTYLHSIQVEGSPEPIADGYSRTYLISLIQDD
jgi:hypothetical protein